MKGKYNMGNWITPLSADVNNNDVAWSVLVGGVYGYACYDLYNSECYWSRFF